MFNGPIGAMVPGPSPEVNGADPTFHRFKRLEEASELAPAFPVVADVDDTIRLARTVWTRPRRRCLLRRTVATGLSRRVVPKKKE